MENLAATPLPIAGQPIFPQVRALFVQQLEQLGLRKTPERFAILEEIYKRGDHFDAEALYVHMKAADYRVSRATVYNTLDLLTNCELVRKHHFGKNLAQYERAFGSRQHDHAVCTVCERVIEFCDPRLQQIKDLMGEMLHFQVAYHSLNLFGVCETCQQERAFGAAKTTSATDEGAGWGD